jgi:hypothetical protein
MLMALRNSSVVTGKDRIVAWLLLLLHALALVISVLLLLSPNKLFNKHSGLATVLLNSTLLVSPLSNGWQAADSPSSSTNLTAPSAA